MAEDRYALGGVTPLHMIHKWSIEHPYAVLSFWASVVILAVLVVVTGYLPRRIMPYVEQPLIAVVTMMPGMSAQERGIWQIIDAIHKEALRTIPGVRRVQIKEMGVDVMATAAAPSTSSSPARILKSFTLRTVRRL